MEAGAWGGNGKENFMSEKVVERKQHWGMQEHDEGNRRRRWRDGRLRISNSNF